MNSEPEISRGQPSSAAWLNPLSIHLSKRDRTLAWVVGKSRCSPWPLTLHSSGCTSDAPQSIRRPLGSTSCTNAVMAASSAAGVKLRTTK